MLTVVLCPALGAIMRPDMLKTTTIHALEEHLFESHELLHCCDHRAHHVGNVDLNNFFAIHCAGVSDCDREPQRLPLLEVLTF